MLRPGAVDFWRRCGATAGKSCREREEDDEESGGRSENLGALMLAAAADSTHQGHKLGISSAGCPSAAQLCSVPHISNSYINCDSQRERYIQMEQCLQGEGWRSEN